MRQLLKAATVMLAGTLLLGYAPDASAAAPPTSDCVYCNNQRVRVERFVPKEKGRRPAVILLHGFDGMQDNGTLYRGVAGRLAAKGYVAVIVHYHDRTATKKQDLPGLLKRFSASLDASRQRTERWKDVETTFTLWLEAVEAVVGDARAHPRVDPQRVGLVGISLGGFLAASAAAQSEGRVRCFTSLFGGLPRSLEKLAAKMPPALLIHGDADEVVPVREAHGLRDLLKQERRDCDLTVYKGVGHSFVRNGKTDLLAAYDAEQKVLAFLSRQMKTDQTRR